MSYSSLECEEQERKLFVGGLNKSQTNEDGLKNFFVQYGNIIDCTIMRDGDKQSRGFGFVLFELSSSVDEIIAYKKEGKNFTLDDHHIEVKRALPKVPGGNAGTSRTGGLYRKIFVGGLPSTIEDDDLRKYFERFGRVNEVELLRDRESNRLRGFAFVTFDDEDSADKCIQRRTHEICKKICEVKRAQTRSTLTKFEHEDGGRHRENYHNSNHHNRDGDRHHNSPHQGPPQGSNLSMPEVNQLIQQAFVMGQQSVLQPSAMQPPTAASLLALAGSSAAPYAAPPMNNTLLQALIGQQQQANQPPHAAMGPPPASTQAGAINQLAQLLQGKIDPNALSALLKPEHDIRSPAVGKQSNTSGGFSTSYPPTAAYDLYYNQQNSGNYSSSKEESDSKRYRPY